MMCSKQAVSPARSRIASSTYDMGNAQRKTHAGAAYYYGRQAKQKWYFGSQNYEYSGCLLVVATNSHCHLIFRAKWEGRERGYSLEAVRDWS
jgi:hypothetical protein